ncbi:MAG: signal recognition particle protein [Candidatus Dormibacteraceae bacterium]
MFETLTSRLTGALRRLRGKGVLRPEDVDVALREIRLALLEADVHYKVVKRFQERLRERLLGAEISSGLTAAQHVVKVVHDELVELLGGNRTGLRYAAEPPTTIMLAGLQGSGKTTTAVKLALFARREDGRHPMVVALDLRRPAAAHQLRVLADREGIPFFGPGGSEGVEEIATAALAEASRSGADLVILDTSGRLQADRELMEELARLRAVAAVTETLLVADAMTGQEAVNVGRAFHDAVQVGGIVLTKLDGDARGGAALSLREATGQQVRFAGVGERPGDLEIFHADRMASRILGMGDVMTLIERAERVVDRQSSEHLERHLRSGHLTFDDFLAQLRQVREMGPIKGVLEMMPGLGGLEGRMEGSDPEAEARRMEAIILSMTARERAHPEIIDGSRRRRIASGSGTGPADVNRLLKAREAMQRLVKQFTKPGTRRPAPSRLGRLMGGL